MISVDAPGDIIAHDDRHVSRAPRTRAVVDEPSGIHERGYNTGVIHALHKLGLLSQGEKSVTPDNIQSVLDLIDDRIKKAFQEYDTQARYETREIVDTPTQKGINVFDTTKRVFRRIASQYFDSRDRTNHTYLSLGEYDLQIIEFTNDLQRYPTIDFYRKGFSRFMHVGKAYVGSIGGGDRNKTQVAVTFP